MLNITTFLDANSKRLDKKVLYNPRSGEKYSSGEILSIVSEIGRKLKSKNINKGDRVVIYLNNSCEYLFSLFAIWRIGAVAIPTNRIFTASELEYIIHDSQAKLMISDNEAKDLVDIDIYIPENINEYKNCEVLDACNTNWDDLCQLQYTSGTTGKPKGAMLTHGNYFTAIHNECDVLTLKQDDIFLGIYPMAHVGLSWAIAALRAASYYILIEQFDLDEYLKLCEKEEVTVLTGMPPVIHSLTTMDKTEELKHIEPEKTDTESRERKVSDPVGDESDISAVKFFEKRISNSPEYKRVFAIGSFLWDSSSGV